MVPCEKVNHQQIVSIVLEDMDIAFNFPVPAEILNIVSHAFASMFIIQNGARE